MPGSALAIYSMTGHGVGDAPLGEGRVMIEVRAVNHRYLEVRVRLPIELAEHSAMLEERVRRALKRGRVEVTGRLDGDVCGPPVLDVARAREAFAQLCALRDELRPEEPVPLALLSCLPDLFGGRAVCDHDRARAALETACDAACDAAWKMRVREGTALAEDLRHNLVVLGEALERVRARGPEVVEGHRERLRARIERLLGDVEVALDAGRLEHEIALFADRADISEEVARLSSHGEQLRGILDGEDAEAGKKLDFLLQEMTREANTIGSKSADAELAQLVVTMKTAISRMREQTQNVL